MSTNTILLTGAGGQLGSASVRTLAACGEVVAPTRHELDLADADSIRVFVQRIRPRWIVNAAAYTAVDKAESEPELSYAINSDAPRVLGEEARKIGAAVIHFSTDYVFDGSGTRAYTELDQTAPLNVYGASKLAGEQGLAASGAAHLIFRTSWVYGATGSNFLLSILRLARERDRLRIVADQHGAPTWSFDLSRLAFHVVSRLDSTTGKGTTAAAEATEALNGVYHACGAGETTWYGFASAAVSRLKAMEPATKLAEIDPIPASEYPTRARRPANSRLNCSKLQEAFDWRMPDWQESLDHVMTD